MTSLAYAVKCPRRNASWILVGSEPRASILKVATERDTNGCDRAERPTSLQYVLISGFVLVSFKLNFSGIVLTILVLKIYLNDLP